MGRPAGLRRVQSAIMLTQRQPDDALPCNSSSPPKNTRKSTTILVDNVAVSPAPSNEVLKAELKRDAERQALFHNTSNEAMEIPNRYRKVAVKIIRRDESIDDLEGHTEEIERLQCIFEHRFGYVCNVHSITNLKRPQVDLNKAILDHVHEYDDPNSLLIIYYTGHGNQIEGGLELNQDFLNPKGRHMPTAFWDKAEDPVRYEMEGDALAILDCCMASSAAMKCRNGERRTYQLLAASSANSPTCGPGQNSFTTALCDSLEELLEESHANGKDFLLTQLCEKINTKRTTQACLPWDRLQSFERTVQFSRLTETQERDAAFKREEPEKASLLLRLSLKSDELKDSQIKDLATKLPHVCHEANIDLRRINWVRMTTTPNQEVPRLQGADNSRIFERSHDATTFQVRDDAFYEAVRTVNTVHRFRNAVKRKHTSRMTCGNKGESLLLVFKALLVIFTVAAGSMLVRDVQDGWILLGTCATLVLTCKLQKIEENLYRHAV